MNDRPELNLESLPAWARDALEVSLVKQTPRSALAHRNEAAWPLLVDAAVVSAFLPRELAPEAVNEGERTDAEKLVLSFAETTHGPEGVKWSLNHDIRTEVLQAALNTHDLESALSRTAERFPDPLSRALRKCLEKRAADSEHLDLKSLEATRVAVTSLSGVSGVKLPDLADLDRQIEYRRLLAQFERMIGRRTKDGFSTDDDRFFGRDQEMGRLRDYVGMIPAGSIQAAATRAIRWVSRKITGRMPMTVWGIGGVGKTTLISKFMLEHAEAASSRFPFAYLDFDRTVISAKQKGGMLAEMCLQTGSQFKELNKPLTELREEVLQLALKLETTSQNEEMSLLTPYMLRFRQLVDDHVNSLESVIEWARPFLLVFDTFEIAQYTEDNIASLEQFVRGFSYTNETEIWPRLRLIISGRKKVTTFLGPVEEMELGALDAQGSADLLIALARDANKQVSRQDAGALVAAVAKATREESGGVQPLRLRLISEVFKDSPGSGRRETGPSIVRSLLKELSQPLTSDGLAAKVLIDGILIRRVVERVGDSRVKALADPGLVVRRITPDVIKEVMTFGTVKPYEETGSSDERKDKPWVVDEEEAQNIFEAFRREVSLVESDGTALRHRPDVRQQMLPLIRARRPEEFQSLNRLAFDYFRARVARDKNDRAAAAEAIYHGLWLNESLSKLDKLWPNKQSFDPRIDPDEFDQGSPANIFVRAKARAALDPDEVTILPREVALEWLDARSSDLLGEHRVEEAIEALRAAAGDDYELLDEHTETGAVLARLLYRAGRWNDAAHLARHHLHLAGDELTGSSRGGERQSRRTKSRQKALLSFIRTLATIDGKSGGPIEAFDWISEIDLFTEEPLARLEVAAHLLIGNARLGDQAAAQRGRLKAIIKESIHQVKPDQWKKDLRVLRLGILTGGAEMDKLLEIWGEAREQVSRNIEVSVISDLLLNIFRGLPAESEVRSIIKDLDSRRRAEALIRLDKFWRRERATVLEALRKRDDLKTGFWTLVAFDHSEWARPLGNALTRAFNQRYGNDLMKRLRRENFRLETNTQLRQGDGVAVVQYAVDSGRLLELAGALAHMKSRSVSAKGPKGKQVGYPEDVFDISAALLEWHSTILDHFSPPSSSPPSA